jgi:hypothetical protein
MDLLKRLCIIVNGKNVPVFTVTNKDLKDFTTTESDMKKQKSRFPPADYRNTGEDLLTVGLLKKSTSKDSSQDSRTDSEVQG